MDVRTLCLGALNLGEATGYEIKKMFESGLFSHFLEASFGSIYPALTKLTEDGLLTCKSHQQDGKPDKKVYSITQAGRDALRIAVAQPIAADKFKSEFLFVMLYADVLSAEKVTALLNSRVNEIREELARIEDEKLNSAAMGHEFVRLYGKAVMEASLAFLDANRHLVERKPVVRDLETII